MSINIEKSLRQECNNLLVCINLLVENKAFLEAEIMGKQMKIEGLEDRISELCEENQDLKQGVDNYGSKKNK